MRRRRVARVSRSEAYQCLDHSLTSRDRTTTWAFPPTRSAKVAFNIAVGYNASSVLQYVTLVCSLILAGDGNLVLRHEIEDTFQRVSWSDSIPASVRYFSFTTALFRSPSFATKSKIVSTSGLNWWDFKFRLHRFSDAGLSVCDCQPENSQWRQTGWRRRVVNPILHWNAAIHDGERNSRGANMSWGVFLSYMSRKMIAS